MMKMFRSRPWLFIGLLACSFLAGCSTTQSGSSTVPSRVPASATSTAAPTFGPTTLYLAAGQTVYALDLATGAKRWTYTTGLPEQSSSGVYGFSAIASTSLVVYVHNLDDNSLYALKASDGSLQWKVSISKSANDTIYVTSSAIIVGSLFSQQPTSVVAVDPQSGKTLWTQSATGPNALLVGSDVIYESYEASDPYYGKSGGEVQAVNTTTGAVVWQATGHNFYNLALTNNLLYASGDDALHAFDARTGQAVWSHSFNDATVASQAQAGAYHVGVTQDGSTLYLSNGAAVYALNGATHAVIWHAGLSEGVINAKTSGVLCAAGTAAAEGLDPDTGAEKWQAPVLDGYGGVADSGICYYPGLGGQISALDAQTGATRWTFSEDEHTAVLMVYKGTVYVLSLLFKSGVGNDPVLHALSGSNGSIQWTFDTNSSSAGFMTLG
ncbi:MAG TPA: PQQ-binding-like beta-propeller repeat protein [Ktedonobacterales bacterium]|jgi:outer membrane protein assembly factor BamB